MIKIDKNSAKQTQLSAGLYSNIVHTTLLLSVNFFTHNTHKTSTRIRQCFCTFSDTVHTKNYYFLCTFAYTIHKKLLLFVYFRIHNTHKAITAIWKCVCTFQTQYTRFFHIESYYSLNTHKDITSIQNLSVLFQTQNTQSYNSYT